MGVIGRTLAWSRTHEGKKLIRFTLASVYATLITLVAIAVLYGARIITSEIWATLAGNLIGAVPGYYLNRAWAWQKRGRSHFRREVVPFALVTGLGIAFAQIGAWWARDEVHSHHWGHLTDTALVVAANLLSFVVFWVLKLLVFNRIFHVRPLEAIDERLTIDEGRHPA